MCNDKSYGQNYARVRFDSQNRFLERPKQALIRRTFTLHAENVHVHVHTLKSLTIGLILHVLV